MTSTSDVGCHLGHDDDGGDVDQTARAVAAVRRCAVALVGAGRDATDLAEVARRLHTLVDDLEARAPSAHDRMDAMEREGRASLYSPVVGTHNAIAPPVDLRETDSGTDGVVTFSVAYERASDVVHEGAVAMILDVALANANAAAGVAGMTAQLNIRFHRPVPPGQELTITSQHDRVDGRKAYSSAEIRLDDELLVSADGLFIASRNRVPHAN